MGLAEERHQGQMETTLMLLSPEGCMRFYMGDGMGSQEPLAAGGQEVAGESWVR